MDLITLRIIATLVSFGVFLAILWWAYGGAQGKRFAEASRIPFEEDDAVGTRKVVPIGGRHHGSPGAREKGHE